MKEMKIKVIKVESLKVTAPYCGGEAPPPICDRFPS
jgi:hypothetical protein